MDLRLIEIFNAVMQHRSVTEAARTLGVSQPAVSAALKRLEQNVGFVLFRRESRHIVPTVEAQLLHQEALHALAGFAELEDAAAGISAGQRGVLTVASSPGPGIVWLPEIISRFRRDRPDTKIRLLTRSSDNVRSLVSSRAFDVGIAEPPFDRTNTVLKRYRFALQCVLPATHALTAHETLTPDLLEGSDLIITSGSRTSYAAISRAFEASNTPFHPAIECEFFAIALNLVIAGAGICLVDALSISDTLRRIGDTSALVIRPFSPSVFYEVGLLKPNLGELSVLAKQFAKLLDDYTAPHVAQS
ncbi:LysR family transcriptional regulator [Tardiphaga robiniae]|jgi:DNA-binding transcriptional LysR family regulator|nr:LysR family transcriptional regulator [Tardiphaga robiniae]